MAGKGDRARHTVNETWRENYEMAFSKKPVLRCAWCCADVQFNPCERCGNTCVLDRTKPHYPEWSRKTFDAVECKVCDRERPNEGHGTDNWCDPTKTK
jgi:hypothetical protein